MALGPPYLSQLWELPEASAVGEARRRVMALAEQLGLDETDRGRVALVVTEAGTNTVRHGGGGWLLARAVSEGQRIGLELLAVDKGKGMADVGRCLEDGYSTAGSAGTGLGAIRRLSSAFDVYSAPGKGTALLSRLFPRSPRSPADPGAAAAGLTQVGAVCVPYPGEPVSGDAWAVVERGPARDAFLVVDGLGHGARAADAAILAREHFRKRGPLDPLPLLQELHGALRSTRGAACAVAEVDWGAGKVRFAGIGNISATVLGSGRVQKLVSHNGTLGFQVTRFSDFEHALPERPLLVMHSDGLGTRWSLDEYPGLSARDPALVAAVLHRDASRGRDDVTVLAARRGAPP